MSTGAWRRCRSSARPPKASTSPPGTTSGSEASSTRIPPGPLRATGSGIVIRNDYDYQEQVADPTRRDPGAAGDLPRLHQSRLHHLRRRVGVQRRRRVLRLDLPHPGAAHDHLQHDHQQRARGHIGRSQQLPGIALPRHLRRNAVHRRLRPRGTVDLREHLQQGRLQGQVQRHLHPRDHRSGEQPGGVDHRRPPDLHRRRPTCSGKR